MELQLDSTARRNSLWGRSQPVPTFNVALQLRSGHDYQRDGRAYSYIHNHAMITYRSLTALLLRPN